MTPDKLTEEQKQRIRRVKLVLIDNDAVLTDGRIVYGDHGDELKFFDVQDGHGLTMLRRAGYKLAMVSGRKSPINKKRGKELQFHHVYQKALDKLKVFEQALKKFRVQPEEVCYIGDDLIDMPAMRRSGFSVAVANAVDEVKAIAHYVTEKSGGRGAVREVTDLLLKVQGKWADAVLRYMR
jgi:3-deoxy-D-manno-octulosonate 8-phosphate phosphatase (KDO 8-P phosphatase)